MESTNNKPARIRKCGTYKYPEGSLQHNKDIGYNKAYYNTNKKEIECPVCSLPILTVNLKRHKLTKRCIKIQNLIT